jgi:Domain of unknown function (DUF5671)
MHSPQTPKNFFLQLGIFITLYTSAISFLVFLFSVIDNVFPQVMDMYSDTAGIRFSISTLIVVFPLFIWLGLLYRKFVTENPEFKDGKLRKWIIYFTLAVTGATIAGDIIVLINSFLAGEDFTTGFLLKVLSVFVVAGAIFTFCLQDLKGYFDANPKKSKFWSIFVSAVVLGSIILGFVMIGSPSHQRDVNFDSQRVSDLSNIQYQIVNFYQQKGVLPLDLTEVVDPLTGNVIPLDPETFESYKYKATDKLAFSVCANFKTLSDEKTNKNINSYMVLSTNENWQHAIGETCFERKIDTDKFPLFNKQMVR